MASLASSPGVFHLPKMDTLSPLNTNSLPLPPAPGTHCSDFYLCDLTTVCTSYKWKYLVSVLCDWLISLSIVSLMFIHVLVGARISFLFKLNNIPLYG